jgi:hypothetical protein
MRKDGVRTSDRLRGNRVAKTATVYAASNITRILSKNIFLGDTWQLCRRKHLLQNESAVHQSKPGHVLRAVGHSISRETEFKHHTGPRYTCKYSLAWAFCACPNITPWSWARAWEQNGASELESSKDVSNFINTRPEVFLQRNDTSSVKS